MVHEAGAHTPEEADRGSIRISLENGDVWVRWPGLDANVKLGPKDSVCEEMRRFLSAIRTGESA